MSVVMTTMLYIRLFPCQSVSHYPFLQHNLRFPLKRTMAPKRKSRSTKPESSKKPKAEEVAETAANIREESKKEMLESDVLGIRMQQEDVAASEKKHLRSDDVADEEEGTARFLGESVPDDEARQRWPHRYQDKKFDSSAASRSSTRDNNAKVLQAKHHYSRGEVDGIIYDLNDDAFVQADEGEDNYICKIIEMFEAVDGMLYFAAQWFYRAKDTVIKKLGHLIDARRIFFSDVRDDNPLDCLVKKLNIAIVPLNLNLEAKTAAISTCDYYCNMRYLVPNSTFVAFPPEMKKVVSEASSSSVSSGTVDNGKGEVVSDSEEVLQHQDSPKSEVRLLDLYAGCGAMSTGLCLGANLSGLKLVTKWAVDFNKYACETLKLNHPESEVRNETAEDFLMLLKEWKMLCIFFGLIEGSGSDKKHYAFGTADPEEDTDDGSDVNNNEEDTEIFEVNNILNICYGDPINQNKPGLYMKVSWKNYGPDSDSWEPIEGLSNCQEKIKNFVTQGFKSKTLPLPGDVDVICGGPPCQGISGFNRFRNAASPLDDEKNKQLLVYMDIVDYLKPKHILMENVVDILKFSDGYLGRYALGRLIGMDYQTRMGMMAAGAYGLPQFRMRFFLWGARPDEKLPQFPLPTHDVVVRGVIPLEFEDNTVAYEEAHTAKLEPKLFLKDAISDLPAIENTEERDEMPYTKKPVSTFERFIRLGKDEMSGLSEKKKSSKHLLYDHRPLKLNDDDIQRVCQIPKRKGANFRDLPGVRVGDKNKVEFDPNIKRVYLPSGKPLVPDYAMSFMNGTSSKCFGRLWWDETVPTVVTRAEPHNQVIIHPEQDRVLSIRENARLQGFPDYYKLCGPIKERYMQVGNAVAVPVSRALGYSLGLTVKSGVENSTQEPVFVLPSGFPNFNRSSE